MAPDPWSLKEWVDSLPLESGDAEKVLEILTAEGYLSPVYQPLLLKLTNNDLVDMGVTKGAVRKAILSHLQSPSGAGAAPTQATPVVQLPDILNQFLLRAVQEESGLTFPDEVTLGGSKMDAGKATVGLLRMGFEEVLTKDVIAEEPLMTLPTFQWTPGAREDDSTNMTRATVYIQTHLLGNSKEMAAVNVCNRNIFSRAEATPHKRLKLTDTRTDIVIIDPAYKQQASDNPRNVLQRVLGMVDVKTEEAWKLNVDKYRGQGLGQFGGCTVLSGRLELGMPLLLTNLCGASHVFHGIGKRGSGTARVVEKVFRDQATAFRYFKEVMDQVREKYVQSQALSSALADLKLSSVDPLLVSPPRSPSVQVPFLGPQTSLSYDNASPRDQATELDLISCEYAEFQRECSQIWLPPYHLMQEYVHNLGQSAFNAHQTVIPPSYIV